MDAQLPTASRGVPDAPGADEANGSDALTEAVARGAGEPARTRIPREHLVALAGDAPLLRIEGLHAGYGPMEILHGIDLHLGAGQSLCLIGPNGAGKSTVLHSIFGMTDIRGGRIVVGDRDVTSLEADAKLKDAGIAYVLQDSSVFPDLTVEQNLRLGGYLMRRGADAKAAAERILDRYPRLAARRREPARVLSGGERRLLEISRALMMDPRLLLVDEPSIGLEPRYVDMVFEMLRDLQRSAGKSILLVGQNARKGLEFADLGYVLVAGQIAMAGTGRELLRDRAVGRLFLGE
jgi:branched-chain amino acid transport system ATP-binding protein